MGDNTEKKKEYKTKPYFVAFLDFLGSKNVNEKDSEAYLAEIHGVYDSALEMCKGFRDYGEQFETKIFSDNILIAVPVNPSIIRAGKCENESFDASETIDFALGFAAYIQLCALKVNRLIRGGVTIGDLFVDETMVFGRGLNRAYELESQIAVFPRVVVDSSIGESFDDELIAKDFDGVRYVDYLQTLKYSWGGDDIRDERGGLWVEGYDLDCVESVRLDVAMINENISKIRERDCSNEPNRVSVKLDWHTRYLESFLYGKPSSNA